MSCVGVQFFTLRDFTKTEVDFGHTLERVRKIGYQAVQLSAVGCMNGDSPEVSPARARQLLDENGLACVATHRSYDDLLNRTEQEIEFHHTLGCAYAAIGGLAEAQRTRAGFAAFVDESRPMIDQLAAAGIRFGYHNHAWEFANPGREGLLYDVLVNADPSLQLEVDLYWIQHAGVDPVAMLRRCAGRVDVIHVKDKQVIANKPTFAAVGEGNLDWDRILPACREAGVQWYLVEQDTCERDPFDCLASSFRFLTSHGM